jgi:urease accessory protein
MDRDARTMRASRPFVFTNMRSGQGLDAVVGFIKKAGGLAATAPAA